MAGTEEDKIKMEKEGTTNISQKDITQLLEACTFGPFQRWLYTFLFASRFFIVMAGTSLAFITANVPFLCYPPNYNISAIPPNLTENEYLQMLQPGDDQCSVYNSTFTEAYYTMSTNNLSKLQCSYGRKFLTEDFSTIISEYDLVCEKNWLRSTVQSIYFVGYLIGSIVFGVLSDRFGRKPTFFLANACIAVCGVIKIFMPSLVAFMIFYCIEASGFMGASISCYALNLEFAPLNLRTPLSFGHMFLYTFSSMFLPGIVYAISDWYYLELTVCLLPLVNLLFWKRIPESPRWLIGRKRYKETQELIQKIMKKNKIDSQAELAAITNRVKFSFENSVEEENKPDKSVSPKEKNYSFIDLFQTCQLAMITLNICLSWCVISMLYYGVTINSVDMAGNRYLNFFLMVVAEIPSHLCCYYLFKRFDHRKPISFFMMFSGLNCIVSNFVDKGSFWFPLVLVILGKFGIAAAFGSIYLLSAEIFPTVVRGNGLGMASVFARIGGTCAPFILQLSTYVKWLPLSIYGLLSVIAGIFLLFLPETKNKELPQTFDDMKKEKK